MKVFNATARSKLTFPISLSLSRARYLFSSYVFVHWFLQNEAVDIGEEWRPTETTEFFIYVWICLLYVLFCSALRSD